MTVAEFIARLSEFPADMPIRLTADMGFIATDRPDFEVSPAVPFEQEWVDDPVEVDTLFIDIG
jgi:hypothetical protein